MGCKGGSPSAVWERERKKGKLDFCLRPTPHLYLGACSQAIPIHVERDRLCPGLRDSPKHSATIKQRPVYLDAVQPNYSDAVMHASMKTMKSMTTERNSMIYPESSIL